MYYNILKIELLISDLLDLLFLNILQKFAKNIRGCTHDNLKNLHLQIIKKIYLHNRSQYLLLFCYTYYNCLTINIKSERILHGAYLNC